MILFFLSFITNNYILVKVNNIFIFENYTGCQAPTQMILPLGQVVTIHVITIICHKLKREK